ncbi:hypothetical protein [Actinoallomurus sp. CA-150999]|uniref:hypothetical protein n=1 Tax=Actinoallomurus sp. CA-150999 TaxID=3239887 RepID=UPI003D94D82C
MAAPEVLAVLNVRDGRQIGTIELTADGELLAAPRGIRRMVERMSEVYGWGPREAFDGLHGWSDGYLEIVATVPVARAFDGADPETGEPYFDADHPVVDDDAERRRLADYLRAGRPILSTTALEIDRVDRSRGEVVPLSFRTDGSWTWTDTVTYYLETHGLAPDPELRAHIAAARYDCPEVDDASTERALRHLYRSSGGERQAPPTADAAGGGGSPAFTVSGDPAPPPITLKSGDGTLNVAPNLTPEEFEILERMRRGLRDRPSGDQPA